MSLIAADKHYCVVGLGMTGVSCVRYLAARGKSFSVIDSRQNPPGLDEITRDFPDVTVLTGRFDEAFLARANTLVMSPGVALATPEIQTAIKNGAQVTSDIELFLSEFSGQVIAITGSNAKSTVTRWMGLALENGNKKALIGGNIGNAVLDHVDEAFDVAVLELSSFQLELLPKLNADVACVLNISEDHLDRYDSMAHYQQAKQRIYFGTQHAVFNRADVMTAPLVPDSVKVTSFALDEPDLNQYGVRLENNQRVICKGFESIMTVNELALPGEHNIANAMAVIALADAVDNDRQATISALKTFSGLPHRCEEVGTIDGVRYFNDSKSTNVGSTLAAINGLGKPEKNIVLLLGGQGKNQDFSPLVNAVAAVCKKVICFGEDGEALSRLISGSLLVETMNQALDLAKTIAESGEIVLLSPACASFDQFKNFEARGNEFVTWVETAK
ncbi:UDP-N-acetylmuramoyl-L-alanine--D-glutamate ligase [Reinekea marina]|uniref:UDP-N-acetylmuramoylalanine--D-glutamate ligase n=1 Tax=Reinekea marina TaxID=1310421 RepID=A0ABV7WPU1_9GAMM|nr:UDP-N-acetylmuramoyl-L-alanine--D-glutamate ligase [Reinekea marina]MDN3650528.1 UDP-N-acetylmuramoyl-L-alanine--D-glutamate ligase [Reinekea marina]